MNKAIKNIFKVTGSILLFMGFMAFNVYMLISFTEDMKKSTAENKALVAKQKKQKEVNKREFLMACEMSTQKEVTLANEGATVLFSKSYCGCLYPKIWELASSQNYETANDLEASP